MRVWIDQDLCTGDGLCEELAPSVFGLLDDGLAYVKEHGRSFDGTAADRPQGADGLARVPEPLLEAVVDAAEGCPGECIFLEDD
jgi:ferredoxin